MSKETNSALTAEDMSSPEYLILIKININDNHIVDLESRVSVRCALNSIREYAASRDKLIEEQNNKLAEYEQRFELDSEKVMAAQDVIKDQKREIEELNQKSTDQVTEIAALKIKLANRNNLCENLEENLKASQQANKDAFLAGMLLGHGKAHKRPGDYENYDEWFTQYRKEG